MEEYKVLRPIGMGSFGKVYLVRHSGDGRNYVLKVIKLRGIPAKEREACLLEVNLMKRLAHPNIVAFKDSFFADGKGSLCIVMSYCDGGDMSARVSACGGVLLKEDMILHWFVQLALAVHYLHEQRVLHRDIKTANIFLLGSGRLVLGDLGISKALDGTAALARTHIGTPYYMAPECYKEMPYGYKADVWAVGCVLYELATLQHPFEAPSLPALSAKIAAGRFRPIDARYSTSLRALVASLLAVSPAARPSMADVLRQPYVQKKVFSFLSDMAQRSALAPLPAAGGVGTPQAIRAASMHAPPSTAAAAAAAAADGLARAAAAGLGPHAQSLHSQLVSLGLQDVLVKAYAATPTAPAPAPAPAPAALKPAPASVATAVLSPALLAAAPAARVRPLSPQAAKRLVKESQAALEREEERRRAAEAALARLRDEKSLRERQRSALVRRQAERAAGRAAGHATVPLQPPPPMSARPRVAVGQPVSQLAQEVPPALIVARPAAGAAVRPASGAAPSPQALAPLPAAPRKSDAADALRRARLFGGALPAQMPPRADAFPLQSPPAAACVRRPRSPTLPLQLPDDPAAAVAAAAPHAQRPAISAEPPSPPPPPLASPPAEGLAIPPASSKERVLARREAERRGEEESMRAALHAAAFGLMAERRRAQARERDMLRGVGAALAGRLPIHEAVLLDAREDAANGAAVEAAAAVEIVAGAAGGGCCGGGGGAQLADSDSDDSLILGRACAEGEVEVVASMPMAAAAAALRPAAQPLRPDARRRRLGLASATDDDTEIAAAEQELRSELKRSTLRCTNLRSSLAVMRQLAVHAGVHLYAAGGSPSASRAGAAAGQSPLAQPRALDERPIKPSPTPHIFGEPPAVLVEAELVAELAPAAAAATPDAAGACADATTSYDEDEIGDDEGNEQGALLLPPPAAAPVPTPLPPPPSLVERLAPPVTIPEVDNEEEGEDAVTSGSGSASSRSLGGGGRDAWSPAAAALSPASEAVLQALYAGSLAARARATRARLDAALGTTVLARVEAAVAAAAAAGGDIDVSADKAAEDDGLGEAAAAEAAAALAAVVAGLAPAQRALVADVEALVSMEAALL